MSLSATHRSSPLAIYQRMQEAVLRDGESTLLPAALLDENVVVETPFAPGRRRYEGREAWLSYYATSGAGLLVRFDHFQELATHHTAEPGTIIVEYELTGTVRTTGVQAAVTCIAVLRVHGGLITLWREYQDIPTITEALSRQVEEFGGVAQSDR